MNLLLLLSALLSALTGGTSAMRTPAAAQAIACAATAVERHVLPAQIASRPQQALPSLSASAIGMFDAEVAPLDADEPLYASRRRE